MSAEVDLADVKAALKVFITEDDALLSRLIESATRECLVYLDRGELPDMDVDSSSSSSESVVFITQDIFQGIVHMVQADYEDKPEDRHKYRAAAEAIWFPYRKQLGV